MIDVAERLRRWREVCERDRTTRLRNMDVAHLAREAMPLLLDVAEAAQRGVEAYNEMIEAVFAPLGGGEITVGELRSQFHAAMLGQVAALDALAVSQKEQQ